MATFGSSWPVEPAQRVGSFCLGMGVNEALAVVQKMGSLEGAEFSFDEQRLFDTDLSIQLPSLGMQLCFDGFQQDLRLITVCLQPEVGQPPALTYAGRSFAGLRRGALQLRDACAVFGPTHIGDFRAAKPEAGQRAAYLLQYPGLTLEFLLPEEMVEALAASGEHPLELDGHSPPTAVRMWIFAQDSPSFMAPVSALPDIIEAVVVRPSLGVELRGRSLRFGAMPQDVFSDFGPPEQVCVKESDAVRIHSTRGGPSVRTSGPDYYYNYFHLGLDVLFDGRMHIVKKVVLHTNPPTHEAFSQYTRCFFQIPLESGGGGQQRLGASVQSSAQLPAESCGDADSLEGGAPTEEATEALPETRSDPICGRSSESGANDGAVVELVEVEEELRDASSGVLASASDKDTGDERATGEKDAAGKADNRSATGRGADLCIDVRWQWSEIQEALSSRAGCACGKPLIMSQSGGYTPFGSTHFYAFPGLAFEVMQNGYLASVTIFAVPPEDLPAIFMSKAQGQLQGGGEWEFDWE